MNDTQSESADLPSNPETKECPFCAEQVLIRAKKCKHCGEFLDSTLRPAEIPGPATSAVETTEYEAHPPMFRNHPILFIITFALCFLFGIGLLIFLIWWIRSLSTTLTVTSKRTTLRKGLLSKSTSEVYHKDVKNVQVDQSALQRLFDIGTIKISSAGQADFEISVEGIQNPNIVKQIIDECKNA
jgi:membrane protein YdbS with pleckstrin-like domain